MKYIFEKNKRLPDKMDKLKNLHIQNLNTIRIMIDYYMKMTNKKSIKFSNYKVKVKVDFKHWNTIYTIKKKFKTIAKFFRDTTFYKINDNLELNDFYYVFKEELGIIQKQKEKYVDKALDRML